MNNCYWWQNCSNACDYLHKEEVENERYVTISSFTALSRYFSVDHSERTIQELLGVLFGLTENQKLAGFRSMQNILRQSPRANHQQITNIFSFLVFFLLLKCSLNEHCTPPWRLCYSIDRFRQLAVTNAFQFSCYKQSIPPVVILKTKSPYIRFVWLNSTILSSHSYLQTRNFCHEKYLLRLRSYN